MKMSKKDTEKNLSEQKAIIGIHNDILKCKDCKLRYDDSIILGNVSSCEAYPNHTKPNKILLGGDCNEYVRE